ncbi:MAG: hypothetical protein RJB38_452 [Pseudomonadota bacterium]|jgi:hypothetical protein
MRSGWLSPAGFHALDSLFQLSALLFLAEGSLALAEDRSPVVSDPTCLVSPADPTAELFQDFKIPKPDCGGHLSQLEAEAAAEYSKIFPTSPVTTQTIFGVPVSGTAPELASLKATLQGKVPSGWQAAARSCPAVICALGKLLGSEELAQRVLLFHARTGYALSLSQELNQAKGGQVFEQLWSPYEIREIESLSRKLPTELKSLPRLKRVLRVKDGYRYHGHGPEVAAYTQATLPELGIGSESIAVYERSSMLQASHKFENSAASLVQTTLTHEICHNLDFQSLYRPTSSERRYSSNDPKVGFYGLGKWERPASAEGDWRPRTTSGFVSNYAATSPLEDFAESCSAYLLAPHHLKSVSPERYALLKSRFFKGREFLDAEWNRLGANGGWPQLAKAVQKAEHGCEALYARCIEGSAMNAHGEVGVRITSDHISWWTPQYLHYPDRCVRTGRDQMMLEILSAISSDPQYCQNRDDALLVKASRELCSSSTTKIQETALAVAATMIEDARESCLKSWNYTSECASDHLIRKNPQTLGASALTRAATRSRVEAIPARAGGLEKIFEQFPPHLWLSACAKQITGLKGQLKRTDRGYEGALWYSSKDQTSKDMDFRYPVDTRSPNTIPFERSCITAMKEALEKEGAKLPGVDRISEWRAAMNSAAFHQAWRDFETEVLSNLSFLTRFSSRSKALLKKFEEKNPEQRGGIASDDLAEALSRIRR